MVLLLPLNAVAAVTDMGIGWCTYVYLCVLGYVSILDLNVSIKLLYSTTSKHRVDDGALSLLFLAIRADIR